jgi:hypothetical protein
MSDDISVLPITDEQAKLGQEIVKALCGVGSFFKEALGSVPQDIIGYLGGDWLRIRRAENIAEMMMRARKKLESWGVKDSEPASLTVAIPILHGAADESRDEIQDLWARLLAAAMTPSRARYLRQSFTEVIKKMDPLDALILLEQGSEKINDLPQTLKQLNVSSDQFIISLENLQELKICQTSPSDKSKYRLSPFGREFLRVISD